MTNKIFILPLFSSLLFAEPAYEVALSIGKQEFHNPAIVAYERIYGIRATLIDNKLYQHGYALQLGYEWSNKINCKDLSIGRAYANFLVQTKEFYSLKPYLLIGLGHESINQNIDSEPDQNIFQYGIGAKYFFTQNINLFLETKAIRKFKTKNSDHITNVGIGYLFNKSTKKDYYQPSSFTLKNKLPIIDLAHTVNYDIPQQKIPSQSYQPIVIPAQQKQNNMYIEKRYYIQMAAYASTNPDKLKRRLYNRGYSNIKLHTIIRRDQPLTLVLIGPYKSRNSATHQLKELKKLKRGAFIYKM